MVQRVIGLAVMAAGALFAGGAGVFTFLALAFMGGAPKPASILQVLEVVVVGGVPIGLGVGVFMVGRKIWQA